MRGGTANGLLEPPCIMWNLLCISTYELSRLKYSEHISEMEMHLIDHHNIFAIDNIALQPVSDTNIRYPRPGLEAANFLNMFKSLLY